MKIPCDIDMSEWRGHWKGQQDWTRNYAIVGISLHFGSRDFQ